MTLPRILRFAKRVLTGDRQARYSLLMAAHGIDLRWAGVASLGLDEKRSHWYGNSGGPALDAVLRSIPISPSSAALDVGCGKGGAIITLSRYFAQVDGIELSPDLAAVAERNLRKRNAPNSTVFRADAAGFTQLDPYSFVYMFNPFPAVVMEPFLDNLAVSTRRRQRCVQILYKNPVYHDQVLRAFPKVRILSADFRLYQSSL